MKAPVSTTDATLTGTSLRQAPKDCGRLPAPLGGEKQRASTTLVSIPVVVVLLTLTALLSGCETRHQPLTPHLFNTGEALFLAGDGSLPPAFVDVEELKGAQSGYKCRIAGFLGAYSRIDACEAVAFIGNTYYDDQALKTAVAKLHPKRTMVVESWQRYGVVVMAVGALVLVALAFFVERATRRRRLGAGSSAQTRRRQPTQ